jgi:hydroxyacylglutathione hydrolase
MKIKKVVVGTLKTNCYLLHNEEGIIVVDPGDNGEEIMEEIEELNLPVKYIINTHSHFDHIMANSYIEKQTGKKVLNNLKEGRVLKLGEESLEVIYTPGHTKDSICLRGNDFLIGGDVLFDGGHGRTDLPGGSDEEMMKTLERLKKDIPSDYCVYPGHGETFLMKDWNY